MTSEHQDTMDAYSEVFDGLDHLGPGDSEFTRNLVERLRPGLPPAARMGDFGCGTGVSSLILAQALPQARLLSLDFHAPFIEQLTSKARELGLDNRICAVVGDMSSPPSLDGVRGRFDLIWCESAIYSIGRTVAFESWRPLLKPNGRLVFSDVVWQCEQGERSSLATGFWAKEYPEIATPDDIRAELAAADYTMVETTVAGPGPWSNYYDPLRKRLRLLQEREGNSAALTELLAAFRQELHVYDNAGDEVALCYFMASPG